MKFSGSVAAVAAALSTTANARHLAYPGPTGIVALPLDGISPVPTTPPRVHDLFRRANKDKDEEGTTVLMAPDATCGYISGRAGAAYTCGVDATCLFLTSSAGGDGAVACCDTVECNYRASCVDFNDYFQSSKCNDGCEVDAFTLKCTDTALPYCNTISFDGGIIDYWCNNVEISTLQKAKTTYDGQTGGVSFSEVALTDSSSEITFATTGTLAHGASVTADAASDATADASATETSKKDDDKSSTPVGPIVGGVVGGIGAIGLLGLGAFFFLRRRGNKQAANPPAYPPTPMQQQPGTGPGGYNPVPQNMASYYDPKNPYPSPGQQFGAPVVAYYPVQPGTPDPNGQTHHSPPPQDPRLAHAAVSPSPSYHQYPIPGQQPGFQPQAPVIHEAGGEPVKNHPQELA
ncbi:hypothetical protein FDECE_12133 [Fusarium decemcellulare]|nr:hypothetical protein FDECE_12133 [Fusarium decemcellulare]